VKKIATLAGRNLKWTQPRAFKREYELRAGDELAATLRFQGGFSSRATAESGDGCWLFHREGAFVRTTRIRACNSDVVIGTFKANTWKSGGTLEIGGRVFNATSRAFSSRYSFVRENGEALVELKNSGFLHRSAQVTLHPGAATDPQLPILVMLGWYLDLLMQRDAAAVAAAS